MVMSSDIWEGINVLSLFDGMSCGQIALNNLGINIKNYYASEIDKHGMIVSSKNFQGIKHLGDVRNIDYTNLPKIDLLLGGSPCQSFSFAGKQKGMSTKCNVEILTLNHYLELKKSGFEFNGQSYLFWEYINALAILKPKYFLLENVKMSKKWEEILTTAIGYSPILIDSVNVSGQIRKRLYWTNIPNIEQPKDKNIKLSDILEENVSSKYDIKQKTVDNLLKYLNKDYKTINKVPTITTELSHGTGKNFYPKTLREIFDIEGKYRRLTPIEVERLQTVPDNYTNYVSDTQRYKMLGNGWTVDIISHILKNMNFKN